MKVLYCAAVALLAAPVWAQSNPFYGVLYPQLRDFLQLTERQLNAIGEANQRFAEWSIDKQRRISIVQTEIAEETAKSPLDPLALGLRYAEIETICREIRERETEVRRSLRTLLTEAQKTRLNVLEEAAKLSLVIAQAQAAGFLDVPVVLTGNILPASRIYPGIIPGSAIGACQTLRPTLTFTGPEDPGRAPIGTAETSAGK